MPLGQNEQQAPKKPTDYTGVIIVAILLPLFLVFYFLGMEEMGLSVFIVLGMTMLAIRVRWDLRKRIWFWAIIVGLLLLHVPLLLSFDGRAVSMPGYLRLVLYFIGFASLLIVLGAVRLVEKFVVKSPPTEAP